jgi:hypothetical protein
MKPDSEPPREEPQYFECMFLFANKARVTLVTSTTKSCSTSRKNKTTSLCYNSNWIVGANSYKNKRLFWLIEKVEKKNLGIPQIMDRKSKDPRSSQKRCPNRQQFKTNANSVNKQFHSIVSAKQTFRKSLKNIKWKKNALKIFAKLWQRIHYQDISATSPYKNDKLHALLNHNTDFFEKY